MSTMFRTYVPTMYMTNRSGQMVASGAQDIYLDDRFIQCVGVSCIEVTKDGTPMAGPVADASYESCSLDTHRKNPGSKLLTCYRCGTRHSYMCDAI